MPRSTAGRPGQRRELIASRYQLVRELEANSETTEWEAFDTALQRRVRMRLLRAELTHDADATQRFWQAARDAARPGSPVGERVLDGGTDPKSGQAFAVSQWEESVAPAEHRSLTQPLATNVPRLGRRRRRGAVVLGLIVVLAFGAATARSGVAGWLAWVNEPLVVVRPGPSLTLGPVTASPTIGPTPQLAARAPTSTPARAVTATPVGNTGEARRVVNTDGRGVALRGSPGGERLPGKGYDEGATVIAFERSGEWTHIRGTDGREGWVLSVTLAP